MGLKGALYDLIYQKPCRAYARYFVGDKPGDAIYRLMCSVQFRRIHKFWPNFSKPRRFSEKVWSRMLNDRNPLLTVLNDKLAVRDYVAERVGSEYLIPLLWSGENPVQIPYDLLPTKFALKATHGCEYNILVQDKTKIDREIIQRTLEKWLSENYCEDFLIGVEWGYKNIKPRIIIEAFLEEDGKYPVDYKFWCFSGRVESISLHFDRFENHSTKAFNRDFEEGGLNFHLPLFDGEFKLPPNHREMVRVAEFLAEGFDFMRVDLYNVKNNIYFGELTPYPGGVSARFEPEDFDRFLGEKWKSKEE